MNNNNSNSEIEKIKQFLKIHNSLLKKTHKKKEIGECPSHSPTSHPLRSKQNKSIL